MGLFSNLSKNNALWKSTWWNNLAQWSWYIHVLRITIWSTFSEHFNLFELENYRVKRTQKWPKIVCNFPYRTLCNLESHENFLRWLWISIHFKTSFLALSKLSFIFVCQIFSKLCPQTYCQRTKNWSIF